MTSALVGTKNEARARRNAQAFDTLLPSECFARFDETYHQIFG